MLIKRDRADHSVINAARVEVGGELTQSLVQPSLAAKKAGSLVVSRGRVGEDLLKIERRGHRLSGARAQPGSELVTRHLAGSECEEGFNDFVFANLQCETVSR